MEVSKTIELLHKTKFISLVSRGFSHNGHSGEWAYATRSSSGGSSGRGSRAVIIIAMVPRANGGFDYILNKEFRVPLVGDNESGKGFEISFPAGLMDGDELPEQTAIRELAEETPYEVSKIINVSPPLASSSGITDELIYIVRCVAKPKLDGSTALEASEDIETFLAKDSEDPRIPTGKDIVWGVRAWMELNMMARINNGLFSPGG